MHIQTLTAPPAYGLPIWEGNAPTNKGELPLWSGERAPPAIGETVRLYGRGKPSMTVTGYAVACGWLWVQGVTDKGQEGSASGAEIL